MEGTVNEKCQLHIEQTATDNNWRCWLPKKIPDFPLHWFCGLQKIHHSNKNSQMLQGDSQWLRFALVSKSEGNSRQILWICLPHSGEFNHSGSWRALCLPFAWCALDVESQPFLNPRELWSNPSSVVGYGLLQITLCPSFPLAKSEYAYGLCLISKKLSKCGKALLKIWCEEVTDNFFPLWQIA